MNAPKITSRKGRRHTGWQQPPRSICGSQASTLRVCVLGASALTAGGQVKRSDAVMVCCPPIDVPLRGTCPSSHLCYLAVAECTGGIQRKGGQEQGQLVFKCRWPRQEVQPHDKKIPAMAGH
eukprot:1137603-Pelagomonas_calceolata.AAC.1